MWFQKLFVHKIWISMTVGMSLSSQKWVLTKLKFLPLYNVLTHFSTFHMAWPSPATGTTFWNCSLQISQWIRLLLFINSKLSRILSTTTENDWKDSCTWVLKLYSFICTYMVHFEVLLYIFSFSPQRHLMSPSLFLMKVGHSSLNYFCTFDK